MFASSDPKSCVTNYALAYTGANLLMARPSLSLSSHLRIAWLLEVRQTVCSVPAPPGVDLPVHPNPRSSNRTT